MLFQQGHWESCEELLQHKKALVKEKKKKRGLNWMVLI